MIIVNNNVYVTCFVIVTDFTVIIDLVLFIYFYPYLYLLSVDQSYASFLSRVVILCVYIDRFTIIYAPAHNYFRRAKLRNAPFS